jgi:hypothetical protein
MVTSAGSEPQHALGAAATDAAQHAPAAWASTVGVQHALVVSAAGVAAAFGSGCVDPGAAQHALDDVLNPSIRLPRLIKKPPGFVAIACPPSGRQKTLTTRASKT